MGQWNNSTYRICVKSDDLALSQSGDFGSKHYLTLISSKCSGQTVLLTLVIVSTKLSYLFMYYLFITLLPGLRLF